MRKTGITFLCFSFLLLFNGILFAQEFSADLITISKEKILPAKIFVSKDKIRMETKEVITISRLDKNVIYILMPEENTYMEMPMVQPEIIPTAEKMEGELERKFLGKENISGRVADKYRIVYSLNNNKQTIICWIDSQLGLPLKTVSEDGFYSQEFKNINPGKQPESLFEIPAGYKKFQEPLPGLNLDLFKRKE